MQFSPFPFISRTLIFLIGNQPPPPNHSILHYIYPWKKYSNNFKSWESGCFFPHRPHGFIFWTLVKKWFIYVIFKTFSPLNIYNQRLLQIIQHLGLVRFNIKIYTFGFVFLTEVGSRSVEIFDPDPQPCIQHTTMQRRQGRFWYSSWGDKSGIHIYIYIYIQGVPKKRNDNFLTIKRSNVDGFLKNFILAASKWPEFSFDTLFRFVR